jgi:hypothetical protein
MKVFLWPVDPQFVAVPRSFGHTGTYKMGKNPSESKEAKTWKREREIDNQSIRGGCDCERGLILTNSRPGQRAKSECLHRVRVGFLFLRIVPRLVKGG